MARGRGSGGGARRSGGGFRRSGGGRTYKNYLRPSYRHAPYRYGVNYATITPDYYYYNSAYSGLPYLYGDLYGSYYSPYYYAQPPTTEIVVKQDNPEQGALVTPEGCFDTNSDDPRTEGNAFYENVSCASLQAASGSSVQGAPSLSQIALGVAGLTLMIVLLMAVFKK